jgi:hydroxypyruvate isomerase
MIGGVRIKQSVCFPTFRAAFPSLEDLFAAVAAAGYRAVEFWGHRGLSPDEEFSVADVASLASSHGLAVASFIGHASLPDGCNNPANHDRIEGELRASIELAAAHGVPGMICFAGNRLPGQSDYEGLVECARLMRRVAPYAEQHGVNLNMELLNSKVNHPDYLADRSDWGLALCEMVRSPRVKLLYDIYHMQIMEGDVIRSIRRLMPLIGHFHTAGNPGRNELDDTQELNYRGICSAIAATDYDLYVGHEFIPLGDLRDALHGAFAACDAGGPDAGRAG